MLPDGLTPVFPARGERMKKTKTLLSKSEMSKTIKRLAFEIIERRGADLGLSLVGVQRRGADLAERLKAVLEKELDRRVPLGKLDISLYRDDWISSNPKPNIACTAIPFNTEGQSIVLVDDVLFSGRTVRAALEAILDYGRPKRVELLVLIDRGHRELPIQADYVGKKVETGEREHVDVFTVERDGEDKVCLVKEIPA
jgi:pyrimidine operon attenuation protein/uracil phosphoribosyltransferase